MRNEQWIRTPSFFKFGVNVFEAILSIQKCKGFYAFAILR